VLARAPGRHGGAVGVPGFVGGFLGFWSAVRRRLPGEGRLEEEGEGKKAGLAALRKLADFKQGEPREERERERRGSGASIGRRVSG